MSNKKSGKLLDEVSEVMRLHHYSIHTERTYCNWIKKFVLFHKMTSRDDLKNGETKIEQFLTHLAVDENISASTQNLAMNALVFLYKHVLKERLDKEINAIRAPRKVNVPVVMTKEEVAKIISLMEGTQQLVVKILYGSGLRISEALRIRIHDIDIEMRQITVRSGKGDKDRITTFPTSIIPYLQNHLTRVKTLHTQDLSQGYCTVYLPHAGMATIIFHRMMYIFVMRSMSINKKKIQKFIGYPRLKLAQLTAFRQLRKTIRTK